jgi:hypothetical protein
MDFRVVEVSTIYHVVECMLYLWPVCVMWKEGIVLCGRKEK